MKFSKAWLQTYSTEALPETSVLEELVTLNAFEIEEITKIPLSNNTSLQSGFSDTSGEDTIFDIKVLPNRAHDALGHRGVAKDICALTGNTFVDPHTYYHKDGDVAVPKPTITIADEQVCTRFMSVRIDNVSITPSPGWLKERLEAIGQKSINSIVDITNFVQFSINKPMHAYDAALVQGNTLSARYAKRGEVLTTLDDKQLTLDEQTLVIADSNNPLGLAGIKGGKFSGVSQTTTSLILESANFNGALIRKTSQRYGIRTDASKRFENVISDSLVEEGLRLTISLILECNPQARVSDIVDVYPSPQVISTVSVSVAEINKVLGTALVTHDITYIFTKLLFPFTVSDDIFAITVPDERLDIRIKEDLIEEVARIHSLSAIPSVLPIINRKGIPHKRMYYENKIRAVLNVHGYSDIMTYSFGDTGEVEIIKGQATDKEKLRSTLGRGVLQAFQMNMLNAPLMNLSIIKMYEFGNIFTNTVQKGHEHITGERRHFALCIDDGKKKSSFVDEVALLLSDIKKVLGVSALQYDTVSAKPYVIEIDFDTVIETLPEPTIYEPLTQNPLATAYQTISPYPFISRDIAMWVSGTTSWESIHALCAQVGNPLATRIDLFDTFSKKVEVNTTSPAGSAVQVKTSYAFRLVFQSFEKTLTDEEVNMMIEPYYDVLKTNGCEIR